MREQFVNTFKSYFKKFIERTRILFILSAVVCFLLVIFGIVLCFI